MGTTIKADLAKRFIVFSDLQESRANYRAGWNGGQVKGKDKIKAFAA